MRERLNKECHMFLLAKLHPHLSDTESENYDGPWLNRKGKEEIIERFYREKKRIPLCIDHRDIDAFGYVKPENTVGRVCDLFIDKDGDLIMKCELSKQHQSGYKEVAGDIFTREARWGVSVGTSKIVNPKTGSSSRHLAHVAFTKEPGFGDYDTYISHWGLEEGAINRVIANKYPPKTNLLMHDTLRNKLEGMSNIYFVTFFTPLFACTHFVGYIVPMTTNSEQQEIVQEMETETSQKEQPKTLNLDDKRQKLREMREAAEATGRSYFNMDADFKKAYRLLEEEIEQGDQEQTELVNKLCSNGHYSDEQRERILAILSTTKAEQESLREFASSFAAANVQLHKETNRAYEQRLQQKEQENEALRKQLEQGQVNEHGKRLRGLVQSVIQPAQTFAPTPKAVQQAITAPSQKTLAEQFSLIERPEVKKTEIFEHAPLKQAMDPRFNNFEPPRSHITNNPGVYAILQDFQNALPALAQSKKSYSS